MNVLAFHHVGLVVREIDEAIAFYTNVLGLTQRDDRPAWMPPGAWFDIGSARLGLIVGEPPRATGSEHPHFAVVVEDLEQLLPELQAAGVPLTASRNPLLRILLEDPSGNVVELRQPPSAYVALGAE